MATNKVTTNVIDMSGNTGGLVWAKGTEAQRPTGVAGDLRLNTTDSRLEYKDNADWKRFSEQQQQEPSVDFQADFLVVGWWRRWFSKVVVVGKYWRWRLERAAYVHLLVVHQEAAQVQTKVKQELR